MNKDSPIYISKDKEYVKTYNKEYRKLLKEKSKYTPLITGSPEYGRAYYEFNKERIKHYNYCKKNNIEYKAKGRPPHWRVNMNKGTSLKVNKGNYKLTFD